MRAAIVVAVACLSVAGLCAGQDVQASIKRSTNIPAQELVPALKTLAHERGFHVVFLAEVIGTARTHGAVGELTTTEALTRLLEGTNLVYSYLDDKTVTIIPVNSNKKLDGQAPSVGNLHRCSGLSSDKLDDATSLNQTGSDSTAVGWTASEEASNCVESYSQENQVLATRIASAAGESVQNSDGDSSLNKESTKSVKLEEVVVTAQKKEERLQDVPIAMTVLSGSSLVENNRLKLRDYYTSIPGLNLVGGSKAGGATIAVRGLTSGGNTNPTVGIMIDEAPFGNSAGGFLTGSSTPDIDPSDLARLEVLRGPQGTLYGASSIGGLIKFVTVDPDMTKLSGRVRADTTSVESGGKLGYGIRGSVNIPLSDTLGIRASGYTRQDPGYIDDVSNGRKDINQVDANGGRLAALWRPSDIFSLKISAMLQDATAHGYNFEVSSLGDRRTDSPLGIGKNSHKIGVYSATLDLKLGQSTLTAVSAYNTSKGDDIQDYTAIYGSGACCAEGLYGVSGAGVKFNFDTKRFTQEIRWSSFEGQRIEWLVGAYYTYEDSPVKAQAIAINPSTGANAGLLYDDPYPVTYAETAGFGDLTLNLTDRFKIQFGARESENRQTYQETVTGPMWANFGFENPTFVPKAHTKDSAFTYLVSPQFKLTNSLMVYARSASGYRPGGPNPTADLFGLPASFKPDKSLDYEVGLKGSALGGALSFDASLYYIDWKDIQLLLADIATGANFYSNGGRAKSQGAELSMQWDPLDDLRISGWVAFNKAVLTEDLPPNVFARDGDRLPASSKFSGTLSIQKDFPVAANIIAFLSGEASYLGDRLGDFSTTSLQPRVVFPAYAKFNLSTGLRLNPWAITLFADNVTNRRGILISGYRPGSAIRDTEYIRPRTIGLSVSRNF